MNTVIKADPGWYQIRYDLNETGDEAIIAGAEPVIAWRIDADIAAGDGGIAGDAYIVEGQTLYCVPLSEHDDLTAFEVEYDPEAPSKVVPLEGEITLPALIQVRMTGRQPRDRESVTVRHVRGAGEGW